MFQIPIRNKVTGEEKSFFGLEEIAKFMLDRDDAADWTGWEFAGTLPEIAPVLEKLGEVVPEGEAAPHVEYVTYGEPVAVAEDGTVTTLTADDTPPEMAAQLAPFPPAA
jgi:hypothetical protein